MTLGGTERYRQLEGQVPDLVWHGVLAARELDFPLCVHPGTGRLLAVLAGGLERGSTVVETGTGTGVGLAWMVNAADPGVSFVSVELDADRAVAAAAVFERRSNVTVVRGDAADHWYAHRPDLLVLDGGGGAGKTGDEPIDIRQALAPRGTVTVDDMTPTDAWPPQYEGADDVAKLYWLEHPDLHTTEVQVAPDCSVLVGRLLR